LGPLLFLIYINDIANSSNKVAFRLFADDAIIVYTTDEIDDIESVMNCEMTRVLNYCTINKLSVNMKKKNFMLMTSSRKKVTPINISVRPPVCPSSQLNLGLSTLLTNCLLEIKESNR